MNDIAVDVRQLGPWFHNLHLPCGLQTAPNHVLGDFPGCKWAVLSPELPEQLDGWTVLDVGCNAGFYTFELASRGARVTAVDCDPKYLRQAEWACAQFGLEERVSFRRMQVYDLAREAEPYDLVLFMGVFYHLRYPTLALDIVSRLAKRLLVFQTMTLPGEEICDIPLDLDLDERVVLRDPGWPHMAYVEQRIMGDPTNRWVPNHAAVLALARSTGLHVRSQPGHEIYVCEPRPDLLPGLSPLEWEEYRAAIGDSQARP
jgi:tRNA (mo5U34)-methyltransferase